jgi:hypothetical protein
MNEKQIIKQESDLHPIQIKNNDDLNKGVEILSRLNKYLDDLTEEKEKVTKPLLSALSAERARFKPVEEKIDLAIRQIKVAILNYNAEQIAKQKELAEALKRGEGSLELAVNEGGGAVDKVKTEAGSISFRTDKVVKIVDLKKIPKAYMIPDEKKIKVVLLEGKKVAGAVLEEVQTVVNRR